MRYKVVTGYKVVTKWGIKLSLNGSVLVYFNVTNIDDFFILVFVIFMKI